MDQQSRSASDIDPRLIVLSHAPLNAETPLHEQIGVITPNNLFYHRNRFSGAQLDPEEYRLTVDGEVERPLALSYDELRALPARTLLVTLECAGNGRSSFAPPAEGEPWQYGAVSTAEWTGVPLSAILELAKPTSQAREVLVEGADRGVADGSGEVIPFARSIDLQTALHPDTLLAYAMNGEPLPVAHGFPLRLIVPGWYGMASVKWVARISAIAEPFRGFFQAKRYIMTRAPEEDDSAPPVPRVQPRALLTWPQPGQTLRLGQHRLRGLAWSGEAPVERVEVSVDGGQTWQSAEWTSPAEPYAWRRWEYLWTVNAPGAVTLLCRAIDAAGRVQPERVAWNRLGYANNAIRPVTINVVEG